jgi:MtaA/CmuA family methyltransferase
MNKKQLVLDSIHNKETERVPWVPFVGCHAASLIGVTADEYFIDADLIVKGVKKAYEEYDPDGLPVLFDLQVEAEALGCELVYAKDNPPAVRTHVLEEGKELSDLKIPTEKDGRFPIVLDATRRIVKELGDKIALYGLVTGPFTLALHLKGTDIFYDMLDDPDEVHAVMEFCKEVCIKTSKMYMDAGVDIIALVDPMTSQISSDSFEEFVSPYATGIFDFVRQSGKSSSFFVCGNAKRNIEAMCKTKPDNVSIDENIPLDYVIDICKSYGISVGGNIKLTLTMLFGTPMDNVNDARTCMEIGGKKGYILSPGCDMPFATPPENVKAITSYVHGNITEIFEDEDVMEGVDYVLPDYEKEDKVIIDVITLDSESCAPCQYTMEAVILAAEPIKDKVTIVEHKIKNKEGVACMLKLGASNIPTICVDGRIEYVSILPDNNELTKCFMNRAIEKGLIS